MKKVKAYGYDIVGFTKKLIFSKFIMPVTAAIKQSRHIIWNYICYTKIQQQKFVNLSKTKKILCKC